MRPVSIAVLPLACLAAAWIAGCATERLDASAPSGVNLTGEWKFNPNLSDDPDKLADPDSAPQRAPGSHRGHGGGRGGGGGSPPTAATTGFLPVALTTPRVRPLQAPMHMSITQKEATLVIKTDMPDGTHTADEYTAGTSGNIPYGPGTADRSVGWRGPVFVVTTTVKKGAWREDDFALDEDGRLIVTMQTKGGRLGKLEITRVYDRVRGSQS